MYFGDCLHRLKDCARDYLQLQLFKSANEEHVYQVSSKSLSMVNGLLVTCILETLPHLTPRVWARIYLPLQYFKSYTEEHVYQVSTKSPSFYVGLFVTCISETASPA
ncbi:hypothetical protein AVEN_36755-1 [Araneus ventricosus]|uniref:Uncharacterized protein n=1 Tax=Araneus ventricosus TaxID=182803 RepID=A0A4Y2QVM7_ARAVE|nr:hypothetical protein AVEN_36755-1 [Araneus ventricosus]